MTRKAVHGITNDTTMDIVDVLLIADKLPCSEGYINMLMDARDLLNDAIAVSIHQLLE